MKAVRRIRVISILSLLISTPGYSIKFGNDFTEFELPGNGWNCKKAEFGEYVCRPPESDKSLDGIITIATKGRVPNEDLEFYRGRLKGPIHVGKRAILSNSLVERLSNNTTHLVSTYRLSAKHRVVLYRILSRTAHVWSLISFAARSTSVEKDAAYMNLLFSSIKIFEPSSGVDESVYRPWPLRKSEIDWHNFPLPQSAPVQYDKGGEPGPVRGGQNQDIHLAKEQDLLEIRSSLTFWLLEKML